MQHQYRMYAWPCSLFSAKLRGYLNYKGLDYEEREMWAWDFAVRVPRGVGVVVMPALLSNTAEWLGDTPLIIEALEARHAQNSIAIETPKPKLAASVKLPLLLTSTKLNIFWRLAIELPESAKANRLAKSMLRLMVSLTPIS